MENEKKGKTRMKTLLIAILCTLVLFSIMGYILWSIQPIIANFIIILMGGVIGV